MGTSASGVATARTRTFAAAVAAFMLVLGLAPLVGFAQESVAGGFTPPEYENDARSASPDSDLPSAADRPTLASTLAGSTASIVSADVALDAVDPIVGSFTVDGLTYAVGPDGLSLVAVSSDAVSDGTIVIPASVAYNDVTYDVVAVGPYAFYLSGATSVALPDSIASVDSRTFRSSDVGRVDVAPDNPNLTSFDGALYSVDLKSLLLIPEGRTGSVPIPSEAEVVQASSFSHCFLVDAISVDGDGAAFLSWDGLLYTSDGATLLRVPAGATEITIRDGCTTIAAGAMEGCAKLERISAPASITSISPDLFESVPTVTLPAQMAVQDGANPGVASSLPDQANASAGFIPQLTSMVALTTVSDGLPEADPASITVVLPDDAMRAPWAQAGFAIEGGSSEGSLDTLDGGASEAAAPDEPGLPIASLGTAEIYNGAYDFTIVNAEGSKLYQTNSAGTTSTQIESKVIACGDKSHQVHVRFLSKNGSLIVQLWHSTTSDNSYYRWVKPGYVLVGVKVSNGTLTDEIRATEVGTSYKGTSQIKGAGRTIAPIFEKITYSVPLDKDGGTGGSSYATGVQYGSAMPAITPPTKAGYVFMGYYWQLNGAGAQYYDANGRSTNAWDHCIEYPTSLSTSVVLDSGYRLIAHWRAIPAEPVRGAGVTVKSPKQFMVGDWRQASGTSAQKETSYYYSTTWVRWVKSSSDSYLEMWCGDDYWSFPIGFNTVRTGIAYVTIGGSAMAQNQWYDTQKQSYEVWIYDVSSYTVTFNANGGSVSPGSKSVTPGSTAAAPVPTRSGYSFTGWYAAASGGSALFGGGSSGGTTPAIRGDVTYYAHWRFDSATKGAGVTVKSPKQFMVSDWGQGSGTSNDKSMDYTYPVTWVRWVQGSSESYIEMWCNDDWIFRIGFDTVSTGVKSATIDGSAMAANTWYDVQTTKREVWIYDASSYTVTFNANGGSVSPGSKSVVAGLTTAAPVPTRENYVFTGWYASASGGKIDGSDALFGGGSSGGTTPVIRGNTTYYAHWRLADHDRGAGVTVKSPKQFMVGDWRQESGAKDRWETSYYYDVTWVRWVKSASESYLEMWCDDYWIFRIGFDTVSTGIAYATAGGSSMRENQWYDVRTAALEVWIYDKSSYTVTFNANGGSVSPGSKSVTPGATAAAPVPTRSGYSFTGWYAAASGGSVLFGGGSSGGTTPAIRGDVTYYAHWSLNSYSITYVLDGGAVSGAGNPAAYNVTTDTFTLKNPTRTGYTFTGWSGTGLSGSANMSVQVAKGSTGNRSYTAHWKANSYAVSFDANGGSGGQSASVTATYDSAMPVISTTKPAKAGYAFGGWYDTADASGGTQYYTAACASARTWDKASAATLYARWAAKSITLTWKDGGSVFATTSATYSPDAKVPMPTSDPTNNSGWAFVGWWTASDGGDEVTVDTPLPTDDATYYAHWVPIVAAAVPIEVTARVDLLGLEEQEAVLDDEGYQGYIESRSGGSLEVAEVSFEPLSGAGELFGADVSRVSLQALAEGSASADYSFALDAAAALKAANGAAEAASLAPFALPDGYGTRKHVTYRFDIPDDVLASIDPARFSDATTPVGQVVYTVALAG